MYEPTALKVSTAFISEIILLLRFVLLILASILMTDLILLACFTLHFKIQYKKTNLSFRIELSPCTLLNHISMQFYIFILSESHCESQSFYHHITCQRSEFFCNKQTHHLISGVSCQIHRCVVDVDAWLELGGILNQQQGDRRGFLTGWLKVTFRAMEKLLAMPFLSKQMPC